MILDALTEVSWLRILVATLAYYLLGAVWFSPAFGRLWDIALGFQRPDKWSPGPLYYAGPLVGCFVASIATAILVRAVGARSVADGLTLGAVVGLGYCAAVSCVNAITPNIPHPILYGAVTGGYHALGVSIVAVILTA